MMPRDPSPWGAIDRVTEIAPGIVFVSTSSHGGFHLDDERNAQVPLRWRETSWNRQGMAGWYEEDCDWCLVALTFPNVFESDERQKARAMIVWLAKKRGIEIEQVVA